MKRENNDLSSYVESLQMRGQYIFYKSKALETLGFSESAFKFSANRLAKKGMIARTRGDFYIIIPLEYRSTACLPASWFIDNFMRYLDLPYYVGLLSAASLQGAAHQQPMVFQVITNQAIRPIRIGQLRLTFHRKRNLDPSFSMSMKTETGSMQVSTLEMTAYDLVRYVEASAQINNVATVLIELSEKINVDVLVDYAKKGFLELTIVQRLGYLLEQLNSSLPLTPLAEWVDAKKPNYRTLVTSNTSDVIARNVRWHIFVNEKIEADL